MNVKSAVRDIEVPEFFDSVQREASLSETGRALGCPLSSTSMLPQSLVERGYPAPGNLQAIRATGCSVSFDKVSPGAGVVAVQVPTPVHETPLAVGIGGPSALIRSNATSYGALLQDAVRLFCAPEFCAPAFCAPAFWAPAFWAPATTGAAVRAPRAGRALGAAA